MQNVAMPKLQAATKVRTRAAAPRIPAAHVTICAYHMCLMRKFKLLYVKRSTQ